MNSQIGLTYFVNSLLPGLTLTYWVLPVLTRSYRALPGHQMFFWRGLKKILRELVYFFLILKCIYCYPNLPPFTSIYLQIDQKMQTPKNLLKNEEKNIRALLVMLVTFRMSGTLFTSSWWSRVKCMKSVLCYSCYWETQGSLRTGPILGANSYNDPYMNIGFYIEYTSWRFYMGKGLSSV